MSPALIGFLLGVTTGGCFGMLVTACLVIGDDHDYENPYKAAYENLCNDYDKRGTYLAELYPYVPDTCPVSCPFYSECDSDDGPLNECKAGEYWADKLAEVGIEVGE